MDKVLQVNLYLNVLAEIYPWYMPMFLGVFGAVFGSFITCALYRVPRKLSLRKPDSFCPSCNTPLTALDLIPVLSYLIFRGRCRHCNASISSRYVHLELLCITCGVASYLVFGAKIQAIVAFVMGLCLVYMVWGWVESRHKPYKVLLFFIILLIVFISGAAA